MCPSFFEESTFLWTIGLQFTWSDMTFENSESLWLEICILCRKMCQQTDSKVSRKICCFVVFKDTLKAWKIFLAKFHREKRPIWTFFNALSFSFITLASQWITRQRLQWAITMIKDSQGKDGSFYRLHHLLFWILKALKVTNEDWLFNKKNKNSYKQDFRQAGLAGFTSW